MFYPKALQKQKSALDRPDVRLWTTGRSVGRTRALYWFHFQIKFSRVRPSLTWFKDIGRERRWLLAIWERGREGGREREGDAYRFLLAFSVLVSAAITVHPPGWMNERRVDGSQFLVAVFLSLFWRYFNQGFFESRPHKGMVVWYTALYRRSYSCQTQKSKLPSCGKPFIKLVMFGAGLGPDSEEARGEILLVACGIWALYFSMQTLISTLCDVPFLKFISMNKSPKTTIPQEPDHSDVTHICLFHAAPSFSLRPLIHQNYPAQTHAYIDTTYAKKPGSEAEVGMDTDNKWDLLPNLDITPLGHAWSGREVVA